MTLGQKIQTLRHDAGLSQEGLGEKLGVSRQAISKWEADGAVPEVDKLIALSRLCEVNLHDLLQVEGTSREEPEESGQQPPEEAAENPPEKDEPPRRNGRWWKALCVVLAAAVCIQGVALFRLNEKLEKLEKQGDALTGQAAEIQQLEELTDNLTGQLSSLGSRISQLEQADSSQNEQMESELDPTLPLVSDMDFTIETTEYGTKALKLSLVPAQSVVGVHFEITCPGGTARSHPSSQLEGSSAYTLSMICTEEELSDGFTVSAVFWERSGRKHTQALVKISDITEDSWNAETLWDK